MIRDETAGKNRISTPTLLHMLFKTSLLAFLGLIPLNLTHPEEQN